MIDQRYFSILSSLLLLVLSYGLQLNDISKGCRTCSCRPDAKYGGVIADCSYRGMRHVTLPAPGNITTLLFDYNYLRRLAISDFKEMTNLSHPSIKQNGMTEIQESHERIFRNLEYLDLSKNIHLGLAQIVKIASWLGNNTLKVLRIGYIVTLNPLIVPLDGLYCSFLQNTSLKELRLDGNGYFYVGKTCFSDLPKTIEVLSVRYSMVGRFDAANFTGLILLQSLRKLDITGFVTWEPGNGHYGHWRKTVIPSEFLIMNSIEVIIYGEAFIRADVNKMTVRPLNNNLTTLDFSENLIESVNGPLMGLGNVQNIDLSQNMITSVSKTLFTGSNKVKKLNISHNSLGKSLEEETSADILKQFEKIEVLDLSDNKITFLPKTIFHGINHIRYVDISGNFLTNFDIDLLHMTNLTDLNLRNNKLNKLPQRVMMQLNLLPKVKVIMKDNPLYCSCDTLEFLEWIRDRKHHFGMDGQKCTLTNGSSINLQFINQILSSLHKSCKSDFVLVVSSVSGVFALVLFVSCIVVYRNRWKLRYLYYIGRNRYQMMTDEEDLEIYQYDAFISYADKDRTFVIQKLRTELEGKSGLKICIHSRDFLPGDVITDNIINAIQNSKKTVLVLSPAFLKSEWCIYEFHMARLDGISRKLNNLLVILLEEVAVKQLPKDLALMLSNNSYLEYSTDLYGEAVFWKTLTEGISTTKRLD